MKAYLESVDELGEGHITFVSEHVDGLEVFVLGSVLEFDADKVSDVWGRAADELDDQSGSVLGQSGHVGVVLGDFGHPEQGDEGLVGGSDQKELEGVVIEGDALQGGEDRVQGGSASDWIYQGEGISA